jgi:AcrR family transcriptional regulator
VNQRTGNNAESQLKMLLTRTDWSEILTLLESKSYQRKFQIIEAFMMLVATKGFHEVTHSDIAKNCGITRQLVDHHFPDEELLIILTYRYVYAGFQKSAADGLMAKEGFLNQLKGYIDAVAIWIDEKREHAQFLVQFYALVNLNPKFSDLNKRNIQIGRERIVSLCLAARKQGFFQNIHEDVLAARAFSLQTHILGFLVMQSWNAASDLSSEPKEELWRCCLSILELALVPSRK